MATHKLDLLLSMFEKATRSESGAYVVDLGSIETRDRLVWCLESGRYMDGLAEAIYAQTNRGKELNDLFIGDAALNLVASFLRYVIATDNMEQAHGIGFRTDLSISPSKKVK